MDRFVEKLKEQLLNDFKINDKKGIYGYTQKIMAYNSNKIEGSTLTSEQTASLFDTGTIVNDGFEVYVSKDVEEMQGHFRMFNEVLKTLDEPLTESIIKSYHHQLMTGVFTFYANGGIAGEYKTRYNTVSDLITEIPENIPDRMNALIEEYNSSDKQLIDIVRFHAEYEYIHPFQDGNGRTGRAIIVKQCLNSNIVPVIIDNDEKSRYIHLLHEAQIEKEYEGLLDLFQKQQSRYYEIASKFIKISKNRVNKHQNTKLM